MAWKPTDKQWWKMVDAGMSPPLSIKDHDPNRPFVYDRTYGYFGVSGGMHVFAMAFLHDLHLGGTDGDWWDRTCDRYSKTSEPVQQSADDYLHSIAGTCYGSSLSNRTTCGFEGSLRPAEVSVFGDIRYLYPSRLIVGVPQ